MIVQYERILIAVDGSENSRKAFNRAVQIAKREEAELILAHVVDTKNYSIIKSHLNEINDVYEESEIVTQKMLDDYEQIAKEADFFETKKIIKLGSPKRILIEEIIPEENIDLVILGATGMGTLERALVGSVADSAFRHSLCDVLVIRG